MMGNFFNGSLMSFQEKRPTFDMIIERLPTTVILTTLAITFALLIGIPIAIISAMRPYTWIDHIANTTALAGLSLPPFWIALVLILIFSERLRLLPASGIRPLGSEAWNVAEMVPYLIMPTLVGTLGLLPSVVRYTRSSMLDVLHQDYIRTARSKGLRERTVTSRHALRNALIPVVSLMGAILPVLLGGSVLIETVFGLPGLGRLAVRAAQNRDFPLVLTINMFTAFVVLVSNIVTDLIYTYLDPRIRLG
jgi:peptide/nickel transport system permease protein